jgi:propionyl-CoA carboxylase beta chain
MKKPVDPDPRRALLDAMNAAAEAGGGEERVQKQHEAGRLTARERIERFLDRATFVEIDKFKTHRCTDFGMEGQRIPGDGVVTGYGAVDGRQVFVFAQDSTVFGGSLSGAHAEKICKVLDLALEVGCPIVGLADSGGARIQEGVVSLAGYADIFLRHTLASGVVPQISVIMGSCAGSAVYGPAISDFLFMVRDGSYMSMAGAGPAAAGRPPVTREELGGAATHSRRSGVAHFALEGEEATLQGVRELLSYLPLRAGAPLPVRQTADEAGRRDPALRTIVPDDPAKAYDVRAVVRAVADEGRFLEVQEGYGANLVVGFTRMAGRPVGVVGNQPLVLGGMLDSDAAVKGARFVRFCDAFEIPILTLVDVPGFLPGAEQEWGGLIRHGAKLLYAFAEATVPQVTVVTRRAHGGAYALMASRHLMADVCLAWPTAEITVMPPEAAAGIVYRKEIQAAGPDAAAQAATRQRLAAEYRERFANPYEAARLGYVDEVIRPEDTRPRVIRALEMLRTKRREGPRKKHGNIPL